MSELGTSAILAIFTILNILDAYTTVRLAGGFRKARRNWRDIEANPIQRRMGLVWASLLKFGGVTFVWICFLFASTLLRDILFWILVGGCFMGTLTVWHNTRLLGKEETKN